ncbi:MAG: NUDIX domain-containing protein [Anaerolineales bacterium]|nr:NUDIX domain-containing protein [Anaerolineales bacterium]
MDYLTSLRRKTGPALIPLVYSTVILRDEAGAILFHHRPDFGLWGLPGGILEAGESPAGCARREAFEETGLLTEPARLTAVLSSPRHNILYPNGDRVQQISFYFESRITGGSLRPDRDETSRLAFFPRGNLPATLPWYAAVLQREGGDDVFFDPPEFPAPKPSPEHPGEGESSRTPRESTWAFLRAQIGSLPLVLPGATALIRDEGGRILLVRRIDTGLWMLPGGLLELGESLAGTAIRETEEETGMRIEPLRIRGIFGGHRVIYPHGDILYPVSTWFECAIRSGSLRPDGNEVDRAEFFDPAHLPDMVPGVRERLEQLLASPRAAVFN